MRSLKINVLANFGGQAVAVLAGLLAIPVYLHVLGVESYGLIGFYMSLQAAFSILDLGLSATLSRELARQSHSGDDPNIGRDLVRTLEWIYWPIGLLILVGVLLLSDAISTHWLTTVNLNPSEVSNAIALMGVTTALQWPFALYQGGFRGIERHVTLNLLTSSAAITRTLACILVLLFVSPTLYALLICQAVFALLLTSCSRALLWKAIPRGSRRAKFDFKLLERTRTFTFGLTGISLVSLLLLQSDKLILSSILPLDQFGYYSIATAVAGALSVVVGPFFYSLYPRYSGFVAVGATSKLIKLYHESNQSLAAFVTASGVVIALYAQDLLLLWTHDPKIAERSAPIVSVLVIAAALQGLAHLPYALQLAHGWTSLAFRQNLISIFFLVPAIYWLASAFGGIGASAALLALNLSAILITVPLMHRKILPGQGSSWLRGDIFPPVSLAVAAGSIAKLTVPSLPDGVFGLILLVSISLVVLTAASLGSGSIRSFLTRKYRQHLAGLK